MLSEHKTEFTKENIDDYLKEVAKAYRKRIGKKMPAEMILVGGASVLVNYGFREMTTDIDALINAASCMKDAINEVGDHFGLPNGWLNADFKSTDSYTPKLNEFSKYYKTYANVLSIRTVSGEHLVAMKLRSGRLYKNDLSDILGILTAHKKNGKPITIEQIQNAVFDLYGDWSALSEVSRSFIQNVMEEERYENLYGKIRREEIETKDFLLQLEENSPGAVTASNVDEIADGAQKQDMASVLELLRKRQKQKGIVKEGERKTREEQER